ncbi:MAG: insulinase family protein [Oscillospiraceae bacterium]|jgi:predicted Zn-dependent peptidase|nr:insulinase family protein [Oscillospiraceae bacterium]
MSAIVWETVQDQVLEETYYRATFPGGLEVQVCPKPGYSTAYALYSAKYGSLDAAIVYPDGKTLQLPEGTAHFLEHKLFESDEVDAFALFAKTGASANAFTSFEKTAYQFSCAEHFEKNLEILLGFVQAPYFTQTTVEKEQGIIGQEIRMYQDDPNWREFFEMLGMLFPVHPVCADIAGTAETIAEITADMLYECHRRFYHPANMILVATGNVTVDTAEEIVLRLLKPAEGEPARRPAMVDDAAPAQRSAALQMPVAAPRFLLGWKERTGGAAPNLRQSLLAELCLDVLLGETAPLYEQLLNEGLINPGFCAEYFNGPGYAACLLGGETKQPERTAALVREALQTAAQLGIEAEAFEQARRKKYGQMVKQCNDIEQMARRMTQAYFNGDAYFDRVALLRGFTVKDANERLQALFREGYDALVITEPLKIAKESEAV